MYIYLNTEGDQLEYSFTKEEKCKQYIHCRQDVGQQGWRFVILQQLTNVAQKKNEKKYYSTSIINSKIKITAPIKSGFKSYLCRTGSEKVGKTIFSFIQFLYK